MRSYMHPTQQLAKESGGMWVVIIMAALVIGLVFFTASALARVRAPPLR